MKIKKIILIFILTISMILPINSVKAEEFNGANQVWKVDKQWEFKILAVENHYNCLNKLGASQVVIVHYSFKNIGYNGPLNIYIKEVYDERGQKANNYDCEHRLFSTDPISLNQATNIRSEAFALNNKSNTITINISNIDSNNVARNATFNVPITNGSPTYSWNNYSILEDNKFNYYINDIWKVKDNWEFKIYKVSSHYKCVDDKDNKYGEQVVLINYEVKNIGYNQGLDIYLESVYDEFGNVGKAYECDHGKYADTLNNFNTSSNGSFAYILPKTSKYLYAVCNTIDKDKKNQKVNFVLSIDGNKIEVDKPELIICSNNKNVAWENKKGKSYWYEKINGRFEKQGMYGSVGNVSFDGFERGREIFDPCSNAWYWLDAVYEGAKAVNKEVFMPYIYSNENSFTYADIDIVANESNTYTENGITANMGEQVKKAILNHEGKWVRYDENGKMYKGWYTVQGKDASIYPNQVGNTYYYDYKTGLMAKGITNIGGTNFNFDVVTGALIR